MQTSCSHTYDTDHIGLPTWWHRHRDTSLHRGSHMLNCRRMDLQTTCRDRRTDTPTHHTIVPTCQHANISVWLHHLSLPLSLSLYIYIYMYVFNVCIHISLSLSIYIYIYIYIHTRVSWAPVKPSRRRRLRTPRPALHAGRRAGECHWQVKFRWEMPLKIHWLNIHDDSWGVDFWRAIFCP